MDLQTEPSQGIFFGATLQPPGLLMGSAGQSHIHESLHGKVELKEMFIQANTI